MWRCAGLVMSGLLLLASVSVFGCGGGGGKPHHTVDLGGVIHADGFTDPLTMCTACHGDDLRGKDGPSCYSCHNNANHTALRGGFPHREGATTICPTCHGPNGSGGLGPSCSTCHASYPTGAR